LASPSSTRHTFVSSRPSCIVPAKDSIMGHNAAAAKNFIRQLLKILHYLPPVVVTDKLRSYGTMHYVVMPVRRNP
jgi:hypothetical protein